MVNEEHERRLFEDFAKKRKMSLCRRADKPHLYAFGTQAAWEAWMIRAAIANADTSELARRNALLRQRDDLPVDRLPAHNELVRLQNIVRKGGLE